MVRTFTMPHKVRQYIIRHGMVRIAKAVWSNGDEYITVYGNGEVWGLWSYSNPGPTRWFFFEKGGKDHV